MDTDRIARNLKAASIAFAIVSAPVVALVAAQEIDYRVTMSRKEKFATKVQAFVNVTNQILA